MAAHVYATNAQVVIDHLNLIHDNFGKNVWLTEFACQVSYRIAASLNTCLTMPSELW